MMNQAGFVFEATISERGYSTKPVGTDYAAMRWNRRKVSLSEFISYIKSGYSYCHIYSGNHRKKEKYIQTNYVSIDVDKTDIDLYSFVNTVTLKPTFAYETFSNGKNGLYSYRLVYVFDKPLSSLEFPEMYNKICRMTGLSETRDHCGRVSTQLMNGTSQEAYVFRSDIIYSPITDLPLESNIFDRIIATPNPLFPVASEVSFSPDINISNNRQKQYSTKEPKWKTSGAVISCLNLPESVGKTS